MPKDDDLADILAAEQAIARPSGSRCPVAIAYEVSSDKERATLTEWLAHAELYHNSVITRALKKWFQAKGYSVAVGPSAVSKHRNGNCRCV